MGFLLCHSTKAWHVGKKIKKGMRYYYVLLIFKTLELWRYLGD